MTKPKPKKRYATLRFRDKTHNGRLIAINENANQYRLLCAGENDDFIVVAELVEGNDKGDLVAVRLSNFVWCKS